jgi:hypothetical protein
VRAYTSNALTQLDRIGINGELKEKLVQVVEGMSKRDA